jgi:hypothetical protein
MVFDMFTPPKKGDPMFKVLVACAIAFVVIVGIGYLNYKGWI